MWTFTKIKYSNLPQSVQEAVESWGDEEIIIDETQLTVNQKTKFTEYMNQEGYKLV